MTVRLGWDSSLRLRSVQNDNRVIPSAREESLCYPEPATGGVGDLMLLSI